MGSIFDMLADRRLMTDSTSCVVVGGFFVSIVTIVLIFKKSSKSMCEILEGLLPLVMIVLYMVAAFIYCDLAWKAPVVIIMITGCYYCLMITKLIICNVTK